MKNIEERGWKFEHMMRDIVVIWIEEIVREYYMMKSRRNWRCVDNGYGTN